MSASQGAELVFASGTHTFSPSSSVDVPNLTVTSGIVNVEGAIRVREVTLAKGGGRPTLNVMPGANVQTLGHTLAVEGGYVNLNSGQLSVANVNLSTYGVITGTSDLVVDQNLTWSSGIMGGAGRTISNGTMTIATGGSTRHDMDGRRLENNGAATWNGGTIHMYSNAVLQNSATGTLDITGDGDLWWCNYRKPQNRPFECSRPGEQPQFINNGTVRKTAGTGELRFWYAPMWPDDSICAAPSPDEPHKTSCPVAVVNTGTFEVMSGSVNFQDYVQSAGTLALKGGNISLKPGKALNLDGGTMTGVGTVNGDVRNAAQINLGSTVGTLTMSGAYTQLPSGALNLKIGGAEPGVTHDRLVIGKMATMAGTLTLTSINGFTPAAGDSFAIIGYASRSGSFGTVNGGGTSYTLNVTSTSTTAVAQ
jgi:hypothetical protein